MKKRNKYIYGKSSEERLSGVSDYLQMTARRALICSPVDFGVPFIDLGEISAFNTFWSANKALYKYNSDGVHPNEAGYELFYIPESL